MPSANQGTKTTPPHQVEGAGKKKFPALAWLKVFILPVSLAVAGFWIQAFVTQATIQKEYVSLSIQILSSKEADKGLREWAAALLNHTSPIPLPSTTRASLGSGVAFLPPQAPTSLPEKDAGSSSMAFDAEDLEVKRLKVVLLNSAISSIAAKEPAQASDDQLLAMLEAERDGILRQVFGSDAYLLFKKAQSAPGTLTESENRQVKEISEWATTQLKQP